MSSAQAIEYAVVIMTGIKRSRDGEGWVGLDGSKKRRTVTEETAVKPEVNDGLM